MQFEGQLENIQNQIATFDHQIAGHVNEKIKKLDEKFILKPLNKRDLFDREVRIYQKLLDLYQNNCPFFAPYFGVLSIPEQKKENESLPKPCIVLQDLTLGYCKPCLIDIKMGRQTFEPTANYDKISRELKKYPYQEEIGFRITGMKIWDETKQNYHAYDKHFGRSLLPDSVLPALAMFFHNGLSFRVDIIQEVIQKLKTILIWMKNQSYFKFFCSSILIVYDGLISSSSSSPSPQSLSDLCQVKMIDFAHVIVNHHNESTLTSHPIWLESPTTSSSVRDDHSQDLEQPKDMIPTEVDEGYIHGLTRLIDFLSFLQTTLIINTDDKDNDNNQDSSSSNRHYQQSLQQKFTEFSSFQL